MLVAAAALIIAFIFIIMPQSIRLIGALTGANVLPDSSDTFPPQVPVLSAPPIATPSGQITLTGYGEAKSEVVLVVNASEQSRKQIGDDGQFSVDITLQDGSNTISTYAIDENENESEPSRTITVVMDNQPPKLDISEPQDGQQIELRKNQQISVKGQTDPQTDVYVNDRLAFTQADGTFRSNFQLAEGENILTFRAVDQAGNTSEKVIKVNFRL
jgi:bacillopeptidase F